MTSQQPDPTDPVVRYACRHGGIAHYAADEVIGLSLREYGEWAEAEIDVLRTYIGPGATVLDVGANVGTHTLAFARLVGPAGQVLAFEPQPDMHLLLGRNVVENGLIDRVRTVHAVVGQITGLAYDVPAAPSRQSTGTAIFHGAADRRLAQPSDLGQVRFPLSLVSLDALGLERCDLIKIDVEGMELDVIAGGMELIGRSRPVIYFEFASGDVGALARSHEILTALGYALYWHYANPFNSANIRHQTLNWFGGAVELNILALPPGSEAPPELASMDDPRACPPRPSIEAALPGCRIGEYLPPLFVEPAPAADGKAKRLAPLGRLRRLLTGGRGRSPGRRGKTQGEAGR